MSLGEKKEISCDVLLLRLSARHDQNYVDNYEKNEVRKVTNLHKAESESYCNEQLIPFRKFFD